MAARKSSPRRSGRVGRISVREAAELHHVHGWPAWRIAEERSGTCAQAVVQALRRYGIPMRPPEGQKVWLKDFERARARGWTKSKLAREVGMSVRSLVRAQKRLGFKWPERDGHCDNPLKEEKIDGPR